MHVLITADTVGGVWTYTRELASGLLNRGHRVTLVSFGRLPTASQTAWMQGHKRLSYHPTAYPLEWMQDAQDGIVESARYLQNVIHEASPDVLHLSQFCYGALECGLPKIVVAHSDVLSWWKAVHESAPPDSAWLEWYRATVSRGLRCADAVVAPSRWMLSTLYQHYQHPFCGCVIYNGRSIELFRASEFKENRVLCVGRLWDEAKQVGLLLAGAQAAPVTIAGSIEHPDRKASGPVAFSSSTAFHFCGEQDEEQLCSLYARCGMYAATSRYEPFGLAALEAALSGCALIANDIPVFRELWGNSAFYFQRNDPESLASAIATLATRTPLRQLYSQQAQERARTLFTAHRMVSEYEDLYRTLTCGDRAHEYSLAA